MSASIWAVWKALQGPHGIPAHLVLPADDVAARDFDKYRATGKTLFEAAAEDLTYYVDRILLTVTGSPLLGAEVTVTEGIHAGRSGSLVGATWTLDDVERMCVEVAAYKIAFDDRADPAVEIPVGSFAVLPKWDPAIFAMRKGELLPRVFEK